MKGYIFDCEYGQVKFRSTEKVKLLNYKEPYHKGKIKMPKYYRKKGEPNWVEFEFIVSEEKIFKSKKKALRDYLENN